jgi:hypothetical protein
MVAVLVALIPWANVANSGEETAYARYAMEPALKTFVPGCPIVVAISCTNPSREPVPVHAYPFRSCFHAAWEYRGVPIPVRLLEDHYLHSGEPRYFLLPERVRSTTTALPGGETKVWHLPFPSFDFLPPDRVTTFYMKIENRTDEESVLPETVELRSQLRAANTEFACWEAKRGHCDLCGNQNVPFSRSQRLGGACNASPVAGEGRIYLSDNNGTTFVVQAGEEFVLLASNELGERIAASPAVAGNDLLYRTDSHLYCIGHSEQR